MKKLLSCITALAVALAFMPAIAFMGDGVVSAAAKLDAPDAFKGVASGKTAIKLSWSKVDGADGYIVYKAEKSKFKKVKTIKKGSTVKYTVKKLKANKKYKFKVRAVKSGSKGAYSDVIKVKTGKGNVKSVKLNEKNAVITNGDSLALKATIKPKKNIVSKKITWSTSDKSVATVSKGKVTAKGAGECTITATAHNGVSASCDITVLADMSMAEDVYNMTKYVAAAEDYAFEMGYTLAYDETLGDDSTLFRTAGSDAEHRAAEYLAEEFTKLGLTDIEKVPVTVDKWQFNGASLELEYANEGGGKTTVSIEDMISYASPGTVQEENKDKYDWDNMKIVDVGMGFAKEYEGKDVKGKIVLAGVDQWNETWIDGPYMEAAHQGAAAIITYPVGGYGQKNDDTNNVQDICAPNMGIPCTGISLNDARRIQAAIEESDEITAKLYVDNEVGDENGISYNVIGKIAGKDPNAQQIVVAAHYDKYFYGFQDDCIAVGLVAGIAKAMIDSGYQPQNDIVFLAHGAEEWGEFETSTDWAIGSWEMITEGKPDWRGRTLALLNYELPAIDHGATSGIMRTHYEMGLLGHKILESGLMSHVEQFYPDGVIVQNDDQMTQTDVVAYQFNGVPAFMPRQNDRTQWTQEHYHTQFDDVDTYSAELLEYDIALYAALAIMIDQTPALEMDFGARCDFLDEAFDESTSAILNDAALEGEYKAELAELRKLSADYLAKAQDINSRYEAAVKSGASEEELDGIRAEGKAYNAKALELFQFAQDAFVGLADYATIATYHKGSQNNIEFMDATIDALSDGEVTEDDIWIPAEMYGWYEYYAYLYSPETCVLSNSVLNNVAVEDNWGTNKMSPALDTYDTTQKMLALFDEGKTASADYAEVIAEYKEARATLLDNFIGEIEKEVQGMKDMKALMQ